MRKAWFDWDNHLGATTLGCHQHSQHYLLFCRTTELHRRHLRLANRQEEQYRKLGRPQLLGMHNHYKDQPEDNTQLLDTKLSHLRGKECNVVMQQLCCFVLFLLLARAKLA